MIKRSEQMQKYISFLLLIAEISQLVWNKSNAASTSCPQSYIIITL